MAEISEKNASNCDNACSSCSSNCDSRKAPGIERSPLAEGSTVKRVIGVVSGKGGVGKSLVTSLLAVESARNGLQTAILDADVTGPSIPHSFGLDENTYAINNLIQPAESSGGIKIISTNVLLENKTDPVLWRGPIVASAVKQFWSEVNWGDIDVMFVDMPPGTGDVALTVFQSLPISGIVIVTTPQDMVGMIVSKAIHMANSMSVPVLGLVENMASFRCPDCGSMHNIFGESHVQEVCDENMVELLASLPIDPQITAAVDTGRVEQVNVPQIGLVLDKILKL
ncbi:MAG: ATP-binding protein [Clostridia bacterium]|nr:ATP-binding protein [Clostridia bacterium]NLF20771.1 Mrp/NBP35 family ATP-binding protein [Clostridiaceae bacterium]